MVNGIAFRPFHDLEQKIMEYLCVAKRTTGQIVAYLPPDRYPNLIETLNRLVLEGWVVPVRRIFTRGNVTQWTLRNMNPTPSYTWCWDRDFLVGHHRRDCLMTDRVSSAQSLTRELVKLRDTVTFCADPRQPGGEICIRFTLGDELAIVDLFQKRYGEAGFSKNYFAAKGASAG